MAAGRGTRLGSLTKNQPKPTLKVGGKSIIKRIVENLHKFGIYEIVINLHYLPLAITEEIGADALYFYEEQLLGHEGTVNALRNWLNDDDFFIFNGDTISNVDLIAMKQNHKEGTISALMDVWRCAGVWIYPKKYFEKEDLPIVPYRPTGLVWFDVGTPARLKEARSFFT